MKESFEKWMENFFPWLLNHGVKIVIIIVGAIILYNIALKFIAKAVRLSVVPDEFSSADSEKKREDTLISIFSAAALIIFILLAALMALQEMGVMIGPILAGAGIVGIAVGFGGQYLIRDLISGLFIIMENQYRIGDVVNFDGTGGLVERITLRMTTLRDLNGTVHHVPHGEIKKVANLSKNFARVNLDIGVAYHSDLDKVIEVVNRIGMEMSTDPALQESIIKPPQFLRVDDFADSAIVIKIVGETLPLKQWEITAAFRKRIKTAFDEAGIEIPFPQRVIHQAKSSG